MTTDASVDDLLEELSLEEKCRLVHGATDPEGRAVGYIPGVDRLDIPPFRMVDGPLGASVVTNDEPTTAFPSGLSLAATFDTDLARDHGAALGRETKGLGMDVLLAPGTNLIRVPENGRNFEYFSEDPHHSAAFATAVTAGIESEDVVATPKHYVANNQETNRTAVSAEVNERALRELYLPSFRAAVEAGAGSVMLAYNAVNGTSMCEHARLNTDVLKTDVGFDGYTVSDWFATEGAAAAANGGLDVEMPGISPAELMSGRDDEDSSGSETTADFEVPPEMAGGIPDPETCEGFDEALVPAVESGTVSEERLDDMVSRVLGVMADHGVLDGSREDDGVVDTSEHREHAERVAARGTVLLEKRGYSRLPMLPISRSSARTSMRRSSAAAPPKR